MNLGANTFDKIVKANILASKPLWHPKITLRVTARERERESARERDSQRERERERERERPSPLTGVVNGSNSRGNTQTERPFIWHT